jgi:hypothetical protein
MQIREGAYYRTPGGDVVGPLKRVEIFDEVQFWAGHYWLRWRNDGTFHKDDPPDMDLISEVYVSDTPPAVTETEDKWRERLLAAGPNGPLIEVHDRKTLRDEFAMEAMKKMMDMSGLDVGAHHEELIRAALANLSYGIANAMMEAREK